MSGGKYDIEAANEAAWQASQANLAACPNCGRTFNPDRLTVHLKACKPKGGTNTNTCKVNIYFHSLFIIIVFTATNR